MSIPLCQYRSSTPKYFFSTVTFRRWNRFSLVSIVRFLIHYFLFFFNPHMLCTWKIRFYLWITNCNYVRDFRSLFWIFQKFAGFGKNVRFRDIPLRSMWLQYFCNVTSLFKNCQQDGLGKSQLFKKRSVFCNGLKTLSSPRLLRSTVDIQNGQKVTAS